MQLRKNQSCVLSSSDFQVVNELTKIGYVKVLSSQVSVRSDNKNGIWFKDNISECPGFAVPSHWVIEGFYGDEKEVTITFGIKNAAPENSGSPAN